MEHVQRIEKIQTEMNQLRFSPDPTMTLEDRLTRLLELLDELVDIILEMIKEQGQ